MPIILAVVTFFRGILGKLPIVPMLVILSITAIYTTGYVNGKRSSTVNQLEKDIKGIEKHEEIQRKVGSLSDSDLDKLLRKYSRN